METDFTPWMSLLGGTMIGASAVLLMLLNGRIAGISGILSSLLPPDIDRARWIEGIAFVAGLVFAIPCYRLLNNTEPEQWITQHTGLLILGGVLVGIGAGVGSGCTSGHGVCGISRFSTRSILATITFMITAAGTVYVLHHLIGA